GQRLEQVARLHRPDAESAVGRTELDIWSGEARAAAVRGQDRGIDAQVAPELERHGPGQAHLGRQAQELAHAVRALGDALAGAETQAVEATGRHGSGVERCRAVYTETDIEPPRGIDTRTAQRGLEAGLAERDPGVLPGRTFTQG